MTTAIGDFNNKSKTWYNEGKTSFKGTRIENVFSQLELDQLVNEPTVVTKTIDELQTSHRRLQTSHRQVTDNCRRVTDDYRRLQTATDYYRHHGLQRRIFSR